MTTVLTLLPIWPTVYPPYGIHTVASSLRHQGIEASVVDLNAKIFNDLSKKDRDLLWSDYSKLDSAEYVQSTALPILRPHLKKALSLFIRDDLSSIGFSIYGPNRLITIHFIGMIKSLLPEIKIFIGGPDIKQDSGIEQLLKKGLIDAAIIGEGDKSVVELLKSDFIDCPPGIWKSGESYCPAELVKPETIIPTDLREVIVEQYSFKALPIMLARGCTSRCAFCTEAPFWGKYRMRDSELVIQEMETNSEKLGITRFMFCDSLLNGNPKKLPKFLDRLANSQKNFSFMAFLKADSTINQELVEKLKEAGMYRAIIGFESASKRVLDLISKGTGPDHYQRTINLLHQYEIEVNALFITGLPNERAIDFLKTIWFIVKNRHKIAEVSFAPTVFIASPSPLYKSPEKYGVMISKNGDWYAPQYGNTPKVRAIRAKLMTIVLKFLKLSHDS